MVTYTAIKWWFEAWVSNPPAHLAFIITMMQEFFTVSPWFLAVWSIYNNERDHLQFTIGPFVQRIFWR